MTKIEPIKLTDGTELVPLEPADKEALEAEIKVALDKYDAMYLPAINEEKSLTSITQKAILFLLKKKPAEAEVVSPYVEPNGESTEDAPKAD